MPQILTQGSQLSDFVLHEYDKHFTRDSEVVISGQNLVKGTVISKITASGKITILAPAGADGSEVAIGVMVADVDASAGDLDAALIVRGPVTLRSKGLVWPGGITGGQMTIAVLELAALGLIIRTEIPA